MRTQSLRAFPKFVSLTLPAVLACLLIVTPASAQERYLNLTWVDRSGEVIDVIGERGQYRGLEISPDGEMLAVHAHAGTGGDVLIFDADGDVTSLVEEGTGVQDNAHPIFSPNGSQIVYSSLRDGQYGLYIKSVDGAGEEELVHTSGRAIVPMSWSPDGRHIVFWENTGTEFVLPLDGDREPFRLMEGNSSHSQISPNGRWVAYLANGDVWVRGFPDGEDAWKVSGNGGFFPRWRGDGEEIYFTSAVSFGMIMAADVRETDGGLELSEPRGLFDTEYINLGHPTNYHTYAVSSDGERFLIPRFEGSELVVVDIENGEQRTLATTFSAPAFSPDGSQLAAIRGQRSAWVMDLQTGELREVSALDEERRFALSLAWAPDGQSVAYIAIDLQAGRDALHLVDATREGRPESEVMLPGIGGSIVGYTSDGQSVLYFSPQLGGDALFAVGVDGDHEATEIARVETGMLSPRLSPDGRSVAYHTNALNTNEVWVRSVDFESGEFGEPIRVGGGFGMAVWREDGDALYYVGAERELMMVSVTDSPTLAIGQPERVIDLPDGFPTIITNFDGLGTVSPDGRLASFAVTPEEPPLPLNEVRIVDRDGRVVARPGEPGLYGGRPMISPDGTKVAVGLANRETTINELWLFDLETDTRRMFLADRFLNSWIWSEDGEELIYSIIDFNDPEGGAIYRARADGSGSPEMLYRHWPGTGFNLMDWSADGRFVLFNSGAVAYLLDLDSDADPVELIREEFSVGQALISPDNRYIAFTSDETVLSNAWLWSFDPDTLSLGPASEKWQLSTQGATGPLSWGRDGREITYRNNGAIRVVELTFEPEFSSEPPRALLPQPEGAGNASASRNGERWVFLAPAIELR